VYVEEEYDDNIFLTETNEQDDFIYTISPGVNLSYLTPTGEIELDYEFRRNLYSDFSELDYSAHRARAVARKDFTSWFSGGISELFIRDEDPIELTGIEEFESPSIRQGKRDRYTRNIVEPEVVFRFGENRSIQVGYRNMILRNDREDEADQDENAGNVLLTYFFNIRNGIEIFYEHIDKKYDVTIPPTDDRDFDGDTIRGQYIHNFDPKTSVFVEYEYRYRDFDRELPSWPDYEIYTPSLGFSRDLYENVNLSASAGYTLRDAEGRKDEEEFFGRGTFSAEYKRLLLSLYGETGTDEDYFSAKSLGFKTFWRTGLNSRVQLLERLWVEGFFYIQEEEFVDRKREDKLWSVRGRLNYQILKWLFVSFLYGHSERDSNVPLESYEDNRYFGRLNIQYDITEFF